MEINRFCEMSIRYFLFFVLLFTVGCASSKPSTGKFSEEEMAEFPLANKQGLPDISGGLVLSIGSETITVDQVVSPIMKMLKEEVDTGDFGRFRQQVGPTVSQLIRSKITDILLYDEAKRSTSDGMDEYLDKAVESEVNRFVADHDGNIAEAQDAIEAMGFDWQGFRDYQKKLILTQSYIQQKMTNGAPVTHGELLDHYNANKAERFEWKGTVEFSLIDIQPDKLDLSEDTEISGKEAALKLAGELSERINEGQDFGELAKEHSHGHRAANGGKWEPVTVGSLAKAYEILEAEAQKLQPGKISDPIESEGHVFIIKLEGKTPGGYKSFEEVQDELEAEVIVERRARQYEEMVSKLITQANISKLNEFLEYCIETAYRRRLSGR
jgi:hypothetical protein